MSRELRALFAIYLSSLVAACAAHLSNESLRLRGNLTSSCVGLISGADVSIVGRGRLTLMSGDWRASGLAIDGNSIVGRESVLNLRTKAVTRFERPLPGQVVDVSADGLRVLLFDPGRAGAQRGLAIFDRSTGAQQFVTNEATDGALSPDSSLVAIENANRLKVFKGSEVVREMSGRFPSWLDATTLAYLKSPKTYTIVDLVTSQERVFRAVGKPHTPLLRSAHSQLLYASRTIGDFWSELSCPERYRVMVHENESAPGVVLSYGCKGGPRSFEWINNAELCSAVVTQ